MFRRKELTLSTAAFLNRNRGHQPPFKTVRFTPVRLIVLPCDEKIGTFSAVDSLRCIHAKNFIINRYNNFKILKK